MPRWDQQEDISEEPYHSSKQSYLSSPVPLRSPEKTKLTNPPNHATPPHPPLSHFPRTHLATCLGWVLASTWGLACLSMVYMN